MSSSKNTYGLFNPSGCLTQDTLLRYTKAEVTNDELESIQMHLNNCEFCRDAVEGLASVQHVDQLTENIDTLKNDLKKKFDDRSPKQPAKTIQIRGRIAWIGAAASLIILIGFLYFLTDQVVIKQPQTAEEISIGNETVPPMPKAKNQVNHQADDQSVETEEVSGMGSAKNVSEIPGKEKTNTLETANEDISLPKRNGKLTPMKIQKPQISSADTQILKQLAEESEAQMETATSEAAIASTQPVEYYLGEVIVYNQEFEGIYLDEAVVQDKAIRSAPKSAANSVMIKTESASSEKKSPNTQRNENEHFFTVVDQMPQFPGGQEMLQRYLSENIQYPAKAARLDIQGTVVISFIVEKDGLITNAKIIRGIGGGCDEEALRVILSMPAWQPALKEGKPMQAIFSLPIKFRLR